MSLPLPLKIGDLTIVPTKRLPSNAFTAVAHKQLSFQRAQNGKLYTQKNYEKYTVRIQGLAQDMYPDLRYEYQKDVFIDLYSISNRIETFSASGLTRLFLSTRRIRDDDADASPIVEHPIGTVVSAITWSNPLGATQGFILFTGITPTTGTDNIKIKYFPILSGQIVEMDSDFDWTAGEENWSLIYEEA